MKLLTVEFSSCTYALLRPNILLYNLFPIQTAFMTVERMKSDNDTEHDNDNAENEE
jgi:hypothetical protein